MRLVLKKQLEGAILDVGGGGEGVIGRIYGPRVVAIDNRQEELDEAPGGFEKRLMDADAIPYVQSENGVLDYYAYRYDINEMPTIEAEPVRHGRWIPAVHVGDCCYRCSECQFLRDTYLLDIGNYCPNCGAKMDGGAIDGTEPV